MRGVPVSPGHSTGTYIGWNIYIPTTTVKTYPGGRPPRLTQATGRLTAVPAAQPAPEGVTMPMFLATGPYSSAGAAGLTKVGARQRATEMAAMAERLGGRLEAMYFGLSESDTYIVFEFPDIATAAAIAKAV